MKKTIPYLFEESVKKFANNIFLWEKPDDKYIGTTYAEVKKSVYKLASGLIAYGIQKGDNIALIAEGRNDWVISELAILYAGAADVPLSVKLLEAADLKFRLKHSESKMIFVSGKQYKKIREIKNELPKLEKIVLLDPIEKYEEDEIHIENICKKGENYFDDKNISFDDIWQNVEENDVANISYTSGTTADPKGIMLSHRNYTANVDQGSGLFEVLESFITLLILPWDHSFAHTVGIYTIMKNGASLASIKVGKTANETLRNIPINIKEIKPTFLLTVPALAKNFKKNIEKGIREKGAFVEMLFKTAMKLAYDFNGNGWNHAKGIKKLNKALLWIFDKIIFKKVREGFGGNLKFFVGGGALLDVELQKFFYAVGMPMYQGYGLSESSPVISSNNPDEHKFGTSGKIVENLECKICDEKGNSLLKGETGEIVVKGENIMLGYWENETTTKETLKDGWLHTGDLGYFDKDDFLVVLGRFKSLLISGDGEKYSPEGIEEAMVEQSKYIDQVMLYNNQNSYTVGLFVLNKEAIKRFLKEKNINIESEKSFEIVLKLLRDERNEYYKGGKYADMFSERWLPSSFAILDEAFSEQNRMMNSTMKMVRKKITEKYKDRIELMYTTEAKDVFNEKNFNALREVLC
ncbi:MAG: AMP-binding protein [Bacteroidota bacterium]|nr:AMP-binding protein [Bacteroidota bacterium]